ncbi:MAG: hypothetical protein HDR51_02820 [Treponema sp.]|nr:hypothetical protein [Treponema sp.]MBD5413315.1 hypothetical protein [Treponema sp.]
MTKTFICLANSRKKSGLCIAGKELENHQVFRPVSERITEELSEIEIRYKDGKLPRLLDVITIETKSYKPNDFQKENWLIDTNYYWQYKESFKFMDLDSLCDNPADFWKNTESSYNGCNDRIDSAYFRKIDKSFMFLKLQKSSIIVREEGREFLNPKRKVRIRFNLNGTDYVLPVTHPEVERFFLGKPDGEHCISKTHYLSVSSGTPHSDNKVYLFAAGIICNGQY